LPTLADGWATIADGLHIHRWYLHVEPYRREQAVSLQESHARAYGTGQSLTSAAAKSVVDTFGAGLAEHLFRQQLMAGDLAALSELRPPTATMELAGRRVICAIGRQLIGRRLAVLPAEALYTGSPVLTSSFADEVTALLEQTHLAFVPQLVVDVVVHGDVPETPMGTVSFDPPKTPDHYAERLLDGAARQLATLFVVTRGMYLGGRATPAAEPSGEWRSIEQDGTIGTTEMTAEIVAASIRYRYWERLARAGHSAAHTMLPGQRELVAAYESVVYDVADATDDLNCYDLVTTLYPGPRQFAKYQTGAGAGQGTD
jgi:hypothetical protein